MQKLRSEPEIMASWENELVPLVSIICNTYNHEDFIEDAINGFLMQVTTFPFEVLIHDDASTDHTADIIRTYEKKYPKIIKPIYQKENQYSKGIKPSEAHGFSRASGAYIAVCEGDDYWTDPDKLLKQVSFLESSKDYVVTCHDSIVIDSKKNIIKNSKLPYDKKRDFESTELIKGESFLLTNTLVFRNIIQEHPYERRMVLNRDTFLISLLGHYGKSKYMSDIKPSAYRLHAGGVWSPLPADAQKDAKINTSYWLYRYYKRINEDIYAQHFWDKMLRNIISRTNMSKLFIHTIKECINRISFLANLKKWVKKIY